MKISSNSERLRDQQCGFRRNRSTTRHTGRFIMFSHDYKHLQQENQRTYLNGIIHSHRKTEKVFFSQLEMFDVCAAGDTAHIDTFRIRQILERKMGIQ